MASDARPSHFALRLFLIVDATLLFALGLALLAIPDRARLVFHFDVMPAAMTYLLGILGCVFVSLAIGYAFAARDPVRHVAWIWVGIARATLEALFGIVCVMRGIVNWQQASFGIIIAGAVALAYVVLCPRTARP